MADYGSYGGGADCALSLIARVGRRAELVACFPASAGRRGGRGEREREPKSGGSSQARKETQHTDGDYGGGGYDGDGGFANHGGFSQNPADAPGSASKSRYGEGNERKVSATTTPVTVHMLRSVANTPTDDYVIDGQPVGKVAICGKVVFKAETATKATFVVDDGTGQIKVVMWTSDSDTAYQRQMRESIVAGTHVHVVGTFKPFNGEPEVLAFGFRNVTDHNEMTHHMLSTVLTHCERTKHALNPALSGNAMAGSTAGMGGMGGAGGMYGGGGAAALGFNADAYSMAGSAIGGPGGMNAVQTAVFQEFEREKNSEAGLSVSQVVARLRSRGIQEQDVRNATEFLTNEGHIYSTIDEEHFKTTDDA